MKEHNIDLNAKELKDLDVKMRIELDKMEIKKSELVEQESQVRAKLTDLQDKKEIELMASEELKKTEVILFEKETREYENEHKMKEERDLVKHLKRVNFEKEN